jgi:hypothetical protein
MTRRRVAVTAASVAVWLASLGWLVFWEAFPEWRTGASAGYEALFGDGLLVMDQWMKILFEDEPIGYSHTSVNVDDAGTRTTTTVESQTVLLLTIMGAPQRVRVRTSAELDAVYDMQSFAFDLASQSYTLDVQGTRTGEESYEVVLRTGAMESRSRVAIPRDAVLYSPMTDLAMRRMKPGQSMRINAFNPISMSCEPMTARALRRETIPWDGDSVETTVLSADAQGMEVMSWVADDGRVLRQTTPLGWTMEACDAGEALAIRSTTHAGRDILAALAVPVSGTVDDPRTRARLRVRVRGLTRGEQELATGRQTARATEGAVEMELARDTIPVASPVGAHPADLAADLASTAYVQSAAPEIRRQAEAIVGAETNAAAAALAIHDWVYREIRKEPAVSMPSALDVLKVRSGDCNEHTVLFVALARAAGLPSRIFAGLVYNEGAFYYHAWPAVYAGRWWELDPTLGQPAVDATHIRLLEGEVPDQMALMGMVGRLSVEVRE